MRTFHSFGLCAVICLLSCNENMGQEGSETGPHRMEQAGGTPAQTGSAAANTDYVLIERRRFLDQQGFDRPVEAFSVLCPKDWKGEGGVRWKGVNDCRGEMVSWTLSLTSPDGRVNFQSYPVRAFSWAQDQMMMQSMMAGAQAGGCAVNQPFSAQEYIQGFAQQDLGAHASTVTADQVRMPKAQEMDKQANDVARQFGNNSEQTTTYANGELAWPDGTQGSISVGVVNTITRKQNYLNGGTDVFSNTQVFYCVVMRYPKERKAEAEQMKAVITSSHRVNPIWTQAKDNFMTQLGNIEHAARMDKIRLMGEQSQAYAKSSSDAADRQMRNWERNQANNDTQHTQFIKAIREVETYDDGANGRVELNSGYDHAWSRGDGSYILSNSPNFDPSSVFQDQQWKEMRQVP